MREFFELLLEFSESEREAELKRLRRLVRIKRKKKQAAAINQ